MNRDRLGLVLAFPLLAACLASDPPRHDEAAAIRGAVEALIQGWADAGEAGDWDRVADSYADEDGFAWVERGETRYRSRAEILAGLDQARTGNARIRNDVSNIDVTPLSDAVAAFRADYEMEVSEEGFSYRSSGVLSGVAVRRDGIWRFLQGAFSERPPSRSAAAP